MPRRIVDGQAQPRPYDTQEYKRLRAELLVPGARCHICDLPIRFDVPARHPMSGSVDHVLAWTKGGHPTSRENARPAHFGCNSGKRDREQKPKAIIRSREW
jgi:5-methylcytosine-specific restriction endonuclease McrA